jgi:hypothetical protein
MGKKKAGKGEGSGRKGGGSSGGGGSGGGGDDLDAILAELGAAQTILCAEEVIIARTQKLSLSLTLTHSLTLSHTHTHSLSPSLPLSLSPSLPLSLSTSPSLTAHIYLQQALVTTESINSAGYERHTKWPHGRGSENGPMHSRVGSTNKSV